MGAASRPAPGEDALPPRRILLRRGLRQLGYLGMLVGLLLALLTALSVVAIMIQAQRDDTRQADAILVIAPEYPPIALVEHSFELFRRGYGRRIFLIGPGSAELSTALVGRGVPVEALIVATPGNSLVTQMREFVPSEADHVLLVCEPSSQLLGLKIARDLEAHAYGSPAGDSPDPLTVLRAIGDYWAYVLLG